MNFQLLHLIFSHSTLAALFACAAVYGVLKLLREICRAVRVSRRRPTYVARAAFSRHASDELDRLAIH